MNAIDLIRRMHDHRRWANARLQRASRRLTDPQLRQTFPIGQGSVWATLVHLYGAEWAWIETLTGRVDAAVPGPEAFADLDALFEAWKLNEERWRQFLDGLTPDQLGQPIARQSISTAGEIKTMPMSDVLVHVCTHAQYTGAQMMNMLRQLGAADLKDAAISMTVMSRAESSGT